MEAWNERDEVIRGVRQCPGGGGGWSEKVQGESPFLLVAFANFRGVNISTITDFKRPM